MPPVSSSKSSIDFHKELVDIAARAMSEDPASHARIIRRIEKFFGRLDHPELQLEDVKVLAKVVLGTSGHTRVAIERGAIPMFVKLLASCRTDVKMKAVRALGAIVVDSTESGNYVLDSGALKPLLAILRDHNSELSMLRAATCTLLKICHVRPTPYEQLKPALRVPRNLIRKRDARVVTAACEAFSSLSNGCDDQIQAVIEAGVYPLLVDLLMVDSSYEILKPVLQTLRNIFTGYDVKEQLAIIKQLLPRLWELLAPNQDERMIKAACRTILKITAGSTAKIQLPIIEQLLPHLYKLLAPKRDESIIKVACQTISKITAGSTAQIQAVIQANIIPRLVYHLQHANSEIKRAAAEAIANSTISASPRQIQYLVNQGCIQLLCFFFYCEDPSIVRACSIGLANITNMGEAIRYRGMNNGVNPYMQMLNGAYYIISEGIERH